MEGTELEKEIQAEFIASYLSNEIKVSDQQTVYDLFSAMKAGNMAFNIKDKSNPNTDLFVVENNFLYTKRVFYQRNAIREKLIKLMSISPSNSNQELDFGKDKQGNPQLNCEQRKAVKKGVEKSFLVLTGGPGTGKTHTVKYIVKNLLNNRVYKEDDLVLCAPTGKAQARLKESLLSDFDSTFHYLDDTKKVELNKQFEVIEKNTTTIHQLLGKYGMRLKYNTEKPIPFKVIIVDECSMIDLSLFHDLLMAVDIQKTKLILLGDKHQLPPIGLGAIFTALYEADEVNEHRVELTESRRFTKTSNIGKLATAINKNEIVPIQALSTTKENNSILIVAADRTFEEDYGDDWLFFFEQKIKQNITSYLDEEETARDFSKLTKFTILSAMNVGKDGVNKINSNVHVQIQDLEINQENKKENRPFMTGQLVLVTANQKDLGIFNGDIGIVQEEKDIQYVYFPNGRRIKPQLIVEQKLGYALSIHKSQGSEYENVLVILNKDNEKLLNRQLLYTAVTRAKKLVVIQTTEEVLKDVLEREDKRITNLF